MNDPQLNEMVAEKVMGWKRVGVEDYVSPRHEVLFDGFSFDDWENKGPHERLESPIGEVFYLCGCNGSKGIDRLPDYATDIAAAWEVVEKRRLVVRPTVTGQWCAAVLFSGGGRAGCSTVEETYAEARTAPRAICLAALEAVNND